MLRLPRVTSGSVDEINSVLHKIELILTNIESPLNSYTLNNSNEDSRELSDSATLQELTNVVLTLLKDLKRKNIIK